MQPTAPPPPTTTTTTTTTTTRPVVGPTQTPVAGVPDACTVVFKAVTQSKLNVSSFYAAVAMCVQCVRKLGT